MASRNQHRLRAVCVGVLALLLVAGPARAQNDDAEEVRLGQVYSKRLEAQYRVFQDATAVERVRRIGAVVAAASDRPSLPYSFKIIDLEVPNALSLPGGFIYVTRGLLSFVRSDHELAAVLAHEIVHAAHRHQIIMIRRSNEAAFWTVLVALLSREPAVMIGAQMISIGLMSGYSRDLEREADLTGISYLVKTPYAPVAMLTLMERLARQEQLSPQPDRAVIRDHPIAAERVAYVGVDLNRRGIPIIRRVAANYLRVTVLTLTEQARPVGEILVNETFLLLLPDPARVGVIAARLNRFFDTDPDPSAVNALRTSDGWEIVGGRELLMTLTRADAEFMGMPINSAAGEIQARLQWMIRQDQRMRQFNG